MEGDGERKRAPRPARGPSQAEVERARSGPSAPPCAAPPVDVTEVSWKVQESHKRILESSPGGGGQCEEGMAEQGKGSGRVQKEKGV
eukprot:3656947-Pleurochrysis_carterae.AAC.1